MPPRLPIAKRLAALVFAAVLCGSAHADESAPAEPGFADRVASDSADGIQQTLEKALGLIGIRYRRGGSSPETGFDCSGFVGHVFREGLGLYLPRNATQISKTGEAVTTRDLQPGDLVFFNTMRRAFSHVGIYLGDDKFVHSPRSGGSVRIESMSDSYWRKRFNGARRIAAEQ